MKPQYHFYNNTKFALQGFLAMWRSEKSFRIELFICLPLIIISLFVPCSLIEHILLIASKDNKKLANQRIFIFFAEAINSGIEAVVDLVSPEYHELAGKAKDCASAGVFCAIAIAVLCWVLVLAKALGILEFPSL